MATAARKKHTPKERHIAKTLGLSDAQLAGLLRIHAGYWPGTAAAVLERKGFAFAERDYRGYHTGKVGLTPAGVELLELARKMGY